MTLRTKVAEALRAELRRQSEAPDVMDRIDLYGDPDPKLQGVEGYIDLEALADAALEANREMSEAGFLLAELLCSTLFPASGSWDGARPTYIWEHNALCWLARNRDRIELMNAWTAMLLRDGYPSKPFLGARGDRFPAGYFWNASMEPKREGEP